MSNNKQGKPGILIVDDIPENIQILVNMLRKYDYKISIAQDGLQAIKTVEKVMPDLILLDVMMPELDGFETCKRLKESENSRNIPILFLTAKNEIDDVVKGLDLGAVDYIAKPFNSKELIRRIQTHLELHQKTEELKKSHENNNTLLRVLCHDLANPFSYLNGMTEILETDPAMLADLMDGMKIAVKNGVDIINSVRQMRSIDENKYELKLESLLLKDLLTESVTMVMAKLTKKNIQIVQDLADDITVLVERTSFINSVINNTLTNAIKFSFPDSKIIIKAAANGDHVQLIIKDSGIGMPKELVNDLFDISKTTNRSGTNGEIGTGFGMPLLKSFLTSYNGSVEVISTEKTENSTNHGTQIILILRSG